MNTQYGVVIYTDGGASMPFAGYGIHGYYYEIAENKKGSGHPKFVPTRDGYKLKDKATTADTGMCKVVEYFDGYGALKLESTNNMAEITALIRGYEILKEIFNKSMQISEVLFLLDSEYTRKGATEWLNTWVKRDFIQPNGSPILNRQLWEKVFSLKTELEAKIPKIEYRHVKAHQSEEVELGNNTADRLARVGTAIARNGIFKEYCVSEEANGYWKYQADRHPLLSYKYCYFQTSNELNKPGVYYTGNQSFDAHLFGQRSWDNAFSILETTKNEPLIDSLRERAAQISDGYTKPAMIRLNDLFNQTNHRDISKFGLESLVCPEWTRCDMVSATETPIVRDFVPPMTARYGIESIAEMNKIFSAIKEDDPAFQRKDITSVFYDVNHEKPNKTTLKPNIRNGMVEVVVEIDFVALDPQDGAKKVCPSKINLLFGADLPLRNALKKIETSKPKIEIVWWPVIDGNAFRYAIYVETDDSKSIWMAADSNTRILC